MRQRINALFSALLGTAAVLGIARLAFPRLFARQASPHAALNPQDPAADPQTGPAVVRSAGPQGMRDGATQEWDRIDEAVDESFPASDPPSSMTIH